MDEVNNIISSKPKEGEPWDVIIIGSGPAGLTAAIYTTRGNASTLVIGGEKWGGQLMLTTTVDNYPGLPGIQGPELMQRMRDHSTKFGAEFLEKNVESVDFTKTPLEVTAGGEKYQAKSVIIATGAETRWLGVPGEEKLRGRGVSSCAPCDAPFFKDKKVAVIGGGDSAMEEALVLTKYASSVTIIHRRDAFKASAAMEQKIMKQVKAGKVNVMWNSEVEEFLGDQKLEKLKIKNNKTNETTEVAFDGAFVAIGHTPSTDIFKDITQLDEKGYVITQEGSKTNIEGVFVAGDVHDHTYRQAITAAGFGCMAGMDTLHYLDEKEHSK